MRVTHRLIASGVLGCLASCAPVAVSSRGTLDVNFAASSTPLRAERHGSFFLVDAEVPGRGTLRMLVDTGAESTFLDSDAARRVFGGDVRPSGDRVRSANWTTSSLDGVVRVEELRLGPIAARGLEAPVISLSAIARSLGTRLDGILGWDVLRHGVVRVDYGSGTLEITDAEGTADLPAAESTPLDRYDVAVTTVSVNRARVPLVIDTGSDGGVAVASFRGLSLREPARDGGAVRSIVGVRRVRVARLDGEVRFAGAVLSDPMMETTDGLPRIGAGAMAGGVLVIDGPARRVMFTP